MLQCTAITNIVSQNEMVKNITNCRNIKLKQIGKISKKWILQLKVCS